MKQFTTLDEFAGYTGFVIFSAPWCGPCKTYKPALEHFCIQTGIPLAAVDIDAHRELAAKFAIRAVPTTVAFKEGKPISQAVGVQTVNALMTLAGALPL
jgi:thioredoxin-like negative regulator of GroEL